MGIQLTKDRNHDESSVTRSKAFCQRRKFCCCCCLCHAGWFSSAFTDAQDATGRSQQRATVAGFPHFRGKHLLSSGRPLPLNVGKYWIRAYVGLPIYHQAENKISRRRSSSSLVKKQIKWLSSFGMRVLSTETFCPVGIGSREWPSPWDRFLSGRYSPCAIASCADHQVTPVTEFFTHPSGRPNFSLLMVTPLSLAPAPNLTIGDSYDVIRF